MLVFSVCRRQKKESFDIRFIKKFAPKRFDKFDFCPSIGDSGGILVCWASSFFFVNVLEKLDFAM